MSRAQTSEETRQRILDAALRVFSTKGYASSSISTVARETNSAVGTIYVHFRDKSDLVNQLYRFWKDEKLRSIDFGESDDTPREKFRRAIVSYLRFGVAHSSALKFLEVHYHADYLDEKSVEKGKQVVGRFTSFIGELTDAGALRADPPPLQLAILNGAAIGVLKGIWAGSLQPTEEIFADTERAIWSALRA